MYFPPSLFWLKNHLHLKASRSSSLLVCLNTLNESIQSWFEMTHVLSSFIVNVKWSQAVTASNRPVCSFSLLFSLTFNFGHCLLSVTFFMLIKLCFIVFYLFDFFFPLCAIKRLGLGQRVVERGGINSKNSYSPSSTSWLKYLGKQDSEGESSLWNCTGAWLQVSVLGIIFLGEKMQHLHSYILLTTS